MQRNETGSPPPDMSGAADSAELSSRGVRWPLIIGSCLLLAADIGTVCIGLREHDFFSISRPRTTHVQKVPATPYSLPLNQPLTVNLFGGAEKPVGSSTVPAP